MTIPPDHEFALEVVRYYLKTTGYDTLFIKTNFSISFPTSFSKKHGITGFKGHTFDLVADGLFIEMDGDRDYDYGFIKGKKTIHSHKEQRINDGLIASLVEEHYPYVKLVRLLKEEVNDFRTCAKYLKDELS